MHCKTSAFWQHHIANCVQTMQIMLAQGLGQPCCNWRLVSEVPAFVCFLMDLLLRFDLDTSLKHCGAASLRCHNEDPVTVDMQSAHSSRYHTPSYTEPSLKKLLKSKLLASSRCSLTGEAPCQGADLMLHRLCQLEAANVVINRPGRKQAILNASFKNPLAGRITFDIPHRFNELA